MQKTKKLVAVILSALLLLSVVPFAVSADEPETPNLDRVEAWEANYDMFIQDIFTNENNLGWLYAVSNLEDLDKTMTVYSVLGLYDSAWKNLYDGSVSVDQAEKLLVSILEKVDGNFKDLKLDEIVEVLSSAKDVAEFIEKVNGYVQISEDIGGETWSDALGAVGTAINIINTFDDYRDTYIELYARILTAQAASDTYLDMLEYVAANAEYDVLKTAALNVIADITTATEDLIGGLIADLAGTATNQAVNYAITFAMNSNPYTAVALNVYNIGTKVADVLWNTSDQYAIMDQIVTLFYTQSEVNDWAAAKLDAVADEDTAADAVYAVNAILSFREISNDALYSLKLAQRGGIIGRFKDKLYKSITEDFGVQKLSADIIRTQMFEADIATYVPVTAKYEVFCPVNVVAVAADGTDLFVLEDGNATVVVNDAGIFGEIYCEYNGEYLKVAYLYGNEYAKLVGTAQGSVSCIMDVYKDGAIVDYSFTDEIVGEGSEIVIPSDVSAKAVYYVTNGGSTLEFALNDEFVYPVENTPNTEEIIDAGKEIVEEETNSLMEKIKAFFAKFFSFFTKLFKK